MVRCPIRWVRNTIHILKVLIRPLIASKAVFEIKQERSAQQTQTQQPPAQVMHVVTTQDLAGNTITITQAPDSNMPGSLANYVQLGFSQFQNPSASVAK